MQKLGLGVKLFLAVMPDDVLFPLLDRPGAVCFQTVSTAIHHSSVNVPVRSLGSKLLHSMGKRCLLASLVCTCAFLFFLL